MSEVFDDEEDSEMNTEEGFEVYTEPEEFLSRLKSVLGRPDITEEEYQKRVRELAEYILREYDDLSGNVYDTVDNSEMVNRRSQQKIPIVYHQNEPEHLGIKVMLTEDLIRSLAHACLLTDVNKEVYDRMQDLEELVEDLLERYETVSEIRFVQRSDMSKLILHTTEFDGMREYYTPYIRIDVQSKEIIRPFSLTLTLGEPSHSEDDIEITIYRSEWVGESSRSLEEGLEILREELGGDEV